MFSIWAYGERYSDKCAIIVTRQISAEHSLARKGSYTLGYRDLTTNYDWTDSNSNKSAWLQKQFISTSSLVREVAIVSNAIFNVIVEHTNAVAYVRFLQASK